MSAAFGAEDAIVPHRSGLGGTIRDLLASHSRTAWLVLALSLCLTWLAWHISSRAIEKRLSDRAAFETIDIGVAISKRLSDQVQILRAGAGLFAASQTVTRAEFAQFVKTLQIAKHYPGMQGYGYAQIVQPDAVDRHVARIRGEGFPDYAISPPGTRPLYTSIVYLEPFDWRNRRAFGYDMFSQATRREAMQRARDTGEPAMTRAVTLVQETQKDVQRGFLIYVPVYRKREAPSDAAQRRDLLQGYVYSPFRMDDLMQGVLGTLHAEARLRIYDGESRAPVDLLYDSDRAAGEAGKRRSEDIQSSKVLAFGDRKWTLEITHDAKALGGAVKSEPILIAAGGIAIDLLVFYLITSISRRTQRAQSIARHMTDDLRKQASRARQVLDNIGDGIVLTDRDGLIREINPAGRQILAFEGNAQCGIDLTDLLPGSREALAEQAQHRDTNGSQSFELTAVGVNGEEVPVSVSVNPLPGSGEAVWTWVIRDITEQKRVEKTQREFIAVVSHELRTPLTALSGSLGILSNAAKLPACQTASLIKLAHSNADRLKLLINDILDMEKFKGGEAEYLLTETDFVALLRASVLEMRDFADQAGSVLTLSCDLEAAPVIADRHRLKQILSNLISNALKFNRKGGEVVVTLVERRGGYRLSVADEGCGLAKNDRRKIFSSFYQVDAMKHPEHSGTGLGLPIAQEIAIAHDSRIHLHSRFGAGSTFFFTLRKAGTKGANKENNPSRNIFIDTDAVAV